MHTSDVNSFRERQRPNPYRQTAGFIRSFWAWEYLRRNPLYRTAFEKFGSDSTSAEAADWSLVRFEDPDFDGRVANVFWRRSDCRHVLPLTASARTQEGQSVSLKKLQCRVAVHREEGRTHILFSENGRALQAEISGPFDPEDSVLVTMALPPPKLRVARLRALRRLSDLMVHRHLRPALYPRERRAARLTRVLQALDGSLAGASERDIAMTLFGETRVNRDWHGSTNYLRRHVHCAIVYGHELMDGGYRRLLT